MSTKLVLLGLLKEKSLYGYELKHIIEEHMGDWTNIAFGSIYFALNKLNQDGFVEKISEEKVGNRPSRSIYKITEKGKNEFISLLREIWQKIDKEYYSLDIAIAFSKVLSKDEIKKYIKDRIISYEENLKYLNKHKLEQLSRKEVPKSAKVVFSHSEYHMIAELNWLKELLNDLENENIL
jgi:DNA-binding PadR family transcriptional regulator